MSEAWVVNASPLILFSRIARLGRKVKEVPTPFFRTFRVPYADRDAVWPLSRNAKKVLHAEIPVLVKKHHGWERGVTDEIPWHSKKLPWRHTKRVGNLLDIEEADVSLAPLAAADVRPVEIAGNRQRLAAKNDPSSIANRVPPC